MSKKQMALRTLLAIACVPAALFVVNAKAVPNCGAAMADPEVAAACDRLNNNSGSNNNGSNNGGSSSTSGGSNNGGSGTSSTNGQAQTKSKMTQKPALQPKVDAPSNATVAPLHNPVPVSKNR
jgi:hypothetical protein